MRRALFTAVIISIVLPALLPAQTRKRSHRQPTRVVIVTHGRDAGWRNRWFIEPYAGALKDAYDISQDDENTAFLVGGRFGYATGPRTRLLADLGYSKSNDVANSLNATSYFIYDNTWVFTTGGAEFDVVPGRTSAALGLEAGAAWRRVDLNGQVGAPVGQPVSDRGFSATEVLVPSVTARYRLTARATVAAGLRDYTIDLFEGPVQHSIAFTAGIGFR